ncbi:type ISP restriction/modification enzyme, partial [Leuconostoc mesenteroides]
EGIEKAEDKQKIIVTLYDKFFKTAFKATTEKLGIVFTPIEVVDFIVHSVDDVLKQHFGKSLASEGVHILDPFTGTGTFIVRTLTYLKEQMDAGEISLADITRKFTQELHANEIVLLSYYIAAINIESTFDEINSDEDGYVPFEGIVLTDTFETTETVDTLDDEYFGTNDERLKRQQEVPITAIIGNPPYSARQESDNDNNANNSYPLLEQRINDTYGKLSSGGTQNTLYDSYFKALRWSSDRLSNSGIISFITNNSFIDSATASGVRRSLYKEFNAIYVLNLKGAIRGKKGDDAKREGGNIFDILTGNSIIVLIKDGSNSHEINYFEVPDYTSKRQKLDILKESKVDSMQWEKVIPDKNGDWINQRDNSYQNFIPMNEIYLQKKLGVGSSRDSWVYSFNLTDTIKNSNIMVNNYNYEVNNHDDISVNTDHKYISWSRGLRKKFEKRQLIYLDESTVQLAMYRPFTKKWLYYDPQIIENGKGLGSLFKIGNLSIILPGTGTRRKFSSFITKNIPDLNIFDGGTQIFFESNVDDHLMSSTSNIMDVQKKFGFSDETIIYYIYAILHSTEYRIKYANDLKKGIPRIPILSNMDKFIEIGQKLVDLHINYETQKPWPTVKLHVTGNDFKVKKMRHPKRKNDYNNLVDDLSQIIFNHDITITNIPETAYQYIVNGTSAIEWIIGQYQVSTDKNSGITDDPNDFSDDPKYILNLLLSVITVSMRTLELIDELPEFEE